MKFRLTNDWRWFLFGFILGSASATVVMYLGIVYQSMGGSFD